MAHYFDGPLHTYNPPGERIHTKKGLLKRKLGDVEEPGNNTEGEQTARQEDLHNGQVDSDNAAAESRKSASIGVPQQNLKRQHYYVLNAILHRCLLEEDYTRASRALGTLLRVELQGRMCNIRKSNLWAIAAEILLRRDPATNRELSGAHNPGQARDVQHEIPPEADLQSQQTLTLDGFRDTKQYFARLILQYPHKPHAQGNHSAQQFYPVMFRLWILQVQSEAQRSINMLQTPQPLEVNISNGPIETKSGADEVESLVRRIRSTERDRAREILAAIDELLAGPLYDQNVALRSLRSEIQMWANQLSLSALNANAST